MTGVFFDNTRKEYQSARIVARILGILKQVESLP